MSILYEKFIKLKGSDASMADTIVKKGFEEFDRGTIENIAEY